MSFSNGTFLNRDEILPVMIVMEKNSNNSSKTTQLGKRKGTMASWLNSPLGLELQEYFDFYVMESDFCFLDSTTMSWLNIQHVLHPRKLKKF